MRFEQFRFWVGLLMALDALIVLILPRTWQRMFPGLRLALLARIEAVAALLILAMHLAGV